jgi:hypothetical protein
VIVQRLKLRYPQTAWRHKGVFTQDSYLQKISTLTQTHPWFLFLDAFYTMFDAAQLLWWSLLRERTAAK